MPLSFIIKIFAKINLWIGLSFKKKKSVSNFSNIKSILIKRTDRIGDVVVTLPLLLELSKYFKVIVLTSELNDSFLNNFVETKIFATEPLDFINSIRAIAGSFFRGLRIRKKNIPQYDICLDLNGIRELNIFLEIIRDNLCKHYISFNMGIWNLFLDYSYSGYPVLFSKKQLLESCVALVKDALGVDVAPADYIDFSSKMVKPHDFNLENFVLVNIAGIEKFRGPSPKMYAEMVSAFGFKGKFVIMDEPGRPHFEEFKKHIKKDNVIYLDGDFSLWELLYVSSKSIVYIGADSGISHLLQVPTNAVLFFGTGAQAVWKPYSKNPYSRNQIRDIIIDETVNSRGLRKKIIYASVWCRPCFDIGCKNKRCLVKLERWQGLIVKEIEEMINPGSGY